LKSEALTCKWNPPATIKDIKIVETIKEGKNIYTAAAPPDKICTENGKAMERHALSVLCYQSN